MCVCVCVRACVFECACVTYVRNWLNQQKIKLEMPSRFKYADKEWKLLYSTQVLHSHTYTHTITNTHRKHTLATTTTHTHTHTHNQYVPTRTHTTNTYQHAHTTNTPHIHTHTHTHTTHTHKHPKHSLHFGFVTDHMLRILVS